MLGTLSLVALTLRIGLAMRRRRSQGLKRQPDLLRQHLALARPAVVLAALGLVSGAASVVWLRDWRSFESFHGILGIVTTALFAATAYTGMRVLRGETKAFQHGLLGVLATLVAAVAAMAGFVLLP